MRIARANMKKDTASELVVKFQKAKDELMFYIRLTDKNIQMSVAEELAVMEDIILRFAKDV